MPRRRVLHPLPPRPGLGGLPRLLRPSRAAGSGRRDPVSGWWHAHPHPRPGRRPGPARRVRHGRGGGFYAPGHSGGGLFDAASRALLGGAGGGGGGASIDRAVDKRALRITLPFAATLAPGDSLAFAPPAAESDEPTIVADLGGQAFAAGTLVVTAAPGPSAITPVLTGPATLSGACPGSAAAPGASWDGSASRAGVRPPVAYAWSASAGAPAVLAAAAATATSANAPRLALAPAEVAAFPPSVLPHTLTLTVTDVFGETASVDLAIARADGAVPLLSLPGGTAQAFRAAAPSLRVPVSLDLAAACPGLGIVYAWAYAAGSPTFGASPLPATKDLKVAGLAGGGEGGGAAVAIPGVEVGRAFALRLTARYAGAPSAAEVDLVLTAEASPLAVGVTGSAGDVDPARALAFAAAVADPDEAVTPLPGRLPLSVAWACTVQRPSPSLDGAALPPPTACELPADALTGDGAGGLVLPPGSLPADDGSAFTLTATAGRGGTARPRPPPAPSACGPPPPPALAPPARCAPCAVTAARPAPPATSRPPPPRCAWASPPATWRRGPTSLAASSPSAGSARGRAARA